MGSKQIVFILTLVLTITVGLGTAKLAKAASANLTFTATVAKVENGIGMSGDQRVTATLQNVAAVTFVLTNPSNAPQRLSLGTYDAHFNAVSDISLASTILLPAGGSERVFAYVPVEAGEKRRFRICANGVTGARCGKFIAQQLP